MTPDIRDTNMSRAVPELFFCLETTQSKALKEQTAFLKQSTSKITFQKEMLMEKSFRAENLLRFLRKFYPRVHIPQNPLFTMRPLMLLLGL